eukprot:353149-Chlamydomonas_euryale.AAC.12
MLLCALHAVMLTSCCYAHFLPRCWCRPVLLALPSVVRLVICRGVMLCSLLTTALATPRLACLACLALLSCAAGECGAVHRAARHPDVRAGVVLHHVDSGRADSCRQRIQMTRPAVQRSWSCQPAALQAPVAVTLRHA